MAVHTCRTSLLIFCSMPKFLLLYTDYFFAIVLTSVFNKKLGTKEDDTGNPRDSLFGQIIPANASILTKTAQLMCLIVYVMFLDECSKDIVTAVKFKFSRVEPADNVNCMGVSCILRLLQGLLGTLVVFMFIVDKAA